MGGAAGEEEGDGVKGYRWLVQGAVAGVIGLALALLGDALVVYKGAWIHLAPAPGVLAALVGGAGAGLVAGLLTGVAGGLPVALAEALWLGGLGWTAARRELRTGWAGLLALVSVPAVLAPLTAFDYALLDQRDAGQFVPMLLVLLIALAPTALWVGLASWVGLPLLRRHGLRTAVAMALTLGVFAAFTVRWPSPAEPLPALAGEPGFRAGAAVADISPPPELLAQGVYLGGYGGRPGPATGIHDPITMRVLALEQGGTRLLFIQVDTVGISNRLGARLRAAARTYGGTDHIFIGSTHTHAGPDLQGLWGGVPAAYEEFLVKSLGGAVQEAVGRMEEAHLQVVERNLSGVASNRRGWSEVPERMTVLQAVTPRGQSIATLVNFAVHPTVLPRENMALSGDFVGPMLAEVEEALGGVALYFNGVQGDVVPIAEADADMYETVRRYGERLGREAVQAIRNGAGEVRPQSVVVRTERVRAPLENWGFQLLLTLGVLRYDMRPLGIIPGFDTKVSLVRIGSDVTMVTIPGEMLTRLGAEVDRMLPGRHHLILGLTHDSLGYIIGRDEWGTGRNEGYEESVSVGPVMGPLIRAAIARLVS